jgi:hypothetical protein
MNLSGAMNPENGKFSVFAEFWRSMGMFFYFFVDFGAR